MSLYSSMQKLSECYKGTMFEACIRVWDLGTKLCNIYGFDPFRAEGEVLQNVELRESICVLREYWHATPDKWAVQLSDIDLKNIDTASEILYTHIMHIYPKEIKVCICSDTDDPRLRNFDILLTPLTLDLLDKYKYCDISVVGSNEVLKSVGVSAVDYTILNKYVLKPISRVVFTGDTEYHEEYDDAVVVGWNNSVKQYSTHILGTRHDVIAKHFTHFKHVTDKQFEESIKEL